MRFGVFGIWLAAGLAPCLARPESSAPANSTLELLSKVPSCATTCFLTAVQASSCDPLDLQCSCRDKTVEKSATSCILKSCSIPDALEAKNATEVACGAPVRDKSGQYRTMSICLGVLAVVLVIIRIAFKLFWSSSQKLGPDDKIILATLILRISCTVINVEGLAAHGLGKDVWTLPLDELVKFVMWLYIMEVLYLTELSMLKLSLSAFYLGIFPGAGIRQLLLGTCVLNAVFGVVFVTSAIFQCSPIHYWWTQYSENPGKGQCININALGWSNAAISVVIDVLMIAIPLSQVPKLHLHWKKKLGVVVMFMTGTFVTIVSILRLRSLVGFANSSNPTWDQWEIAYWSTIEVNIGMICTCLPCLRLLLVRVFPKILGNTTASGHSVSYTHDTRGQNVLQSRTSESTHGNELSDLEQSKQTNWQTNATWSTKELLEPDVRHSIQKH